MLKRLFLNLKGLSDASVVSLIKKEYGSAVHFMWDVIKSLVLMCLMNDLMRFVEVLQFVVFCFYRSCKHYLVIVFQKNKSFCHHHFTLTHFVP